MFYVNTILPFSVVLTGRLLGKRVITHVHEYELSPKILNSFLFWVIRNFSSQLVVVSRFLAQNPSLGGKVATLIPNAVTKKIAEGAKPVAWPAGRFQVLMLASLRPYKGIVDFVKLANLMPEVQFVLVLSDAEEEVNDWMKSIAFRENLKIYPVQEDVVPFYQSSHLVLNLAHPEQWLETFGMTVLEGCCFGLPAIVPTQGGVVDLIEHGVNGYLVDYTDLDELVRSIDELSKNQGLWQRMSEEAIRKSQWFSRDLFRSRILNFLKE